MKSIRANNALANRYSFEFDLYHEWILKQNYNIFIFNISSKINCVCGKGGTSAGKIVGGKLSENHIYPWIGALIYVMQTDKQ